MKFPAICAALILGACSEDTLASQPVPDQPTLEPFPSRLEYPDARAWMLSKGYAPVAQPQPLDRGWWQAEWELHPEFIYPCLEGWCTEQNFIWYSANANQYAAVVQDEGEGRYYKLTYIGAPPSHDPEGRALAPGEFIAGKIDRNEAGGVNQTLYLSPSGLVVESVYWKHDGTESAHVGPADESTVRYICLNQDDIAFCSDYR